MGKVLAIIGVVVIVIVLIIILFGWLNVAGSGAV